MALAELRCKLPRGIAGRLVNQYCFEFHHLNVRRRRRTHARRMIPVIDEFYRRMSKVVCSCRDCNRIVRYDLIKSNGSVCIAKTTWGWGGGHPFRVFQTHSLEFWSHATDDWDPVAVCWSCYTQGITPFDGARYAHERGTWVWHGTRRGTWPCVEIATAWGDYDHHAALDRWCSSFPKTHHPLGSTWGSWEE